MGAGANTVYCDDYAAVLMMWMGRMRSKGSCVIVKLLEHGPVCVPGKVSKCLWKCWVRRAHRWNVRIRGLVTDERIRADAHLQHQSQGLMTVRWERCITWMEGLRRIQRPLQCCP